MIKKLAELLESDALEVKREISFIFCNIGYNGDSSTYFNILKENQLIIKFVNLLESPDVQTVGTALDNLKTILSHGEK